MNLYFALWEDFSNPLEMKKRSENYKRFNSKPRKSRCFPPPVSYTDISFHTKQRGLGSVMFDWGGHRDFNFLLTVVLLLGQKPLGKS